MLRTSLSRALAAAVIAAFAALACNPEADNELEKRRRNASQPDDPDAALFETANEDDDDGDPPLDEMPPDPLPPTPVPDAGPPNTCPRARVTTDTLNIRAAPASVDTMAIGALTQDDVVTVKKKVTGEDVNGNAEWFQIDANAMTGFISAYYASCTIDPATIP